MFLVNWGLLAGECPIKVKPWTVCAFEPYWKIEQVLVFSNNYSILSLLIILRAAAGGRMNKQNFLHGFMFNFN